MAAPAVPSPPSKKKYFLKVLAFLAAFYTVVPFLLGDGLARFFPRDKEELVMALADAKVTEVTMNRQQYDYYLDGDASGWHNFNSFANADPAARTGMNDTLGYDPSDLGHYLRLGDRLSKAANSPLLTVRRGSVTTHWILFAFIPESQQPTELPVVESPDSIYIH